MKKVWYFVKLGISQVTAAILVQKGRNCVSMMKANPAFLAPNPLPDPPLADVTEAMDTLDTAEQAYAFNKGKLEKEARDLAYEEAKRIFHLLGGYVQLASNGDKDIILSAGLDVTKTPEHAPAPAAPGNVRATATKVLGQIIVNYGASKGRRFYKVYQTEGDPSLETGWKLIAVTGKNRLVVDHLERFKTYGFRVEAVGAAGVSVPSDAATATAA